MTDREKEMFDMLDRIFSAVEYDHEINALSNINNTSPRLLAIRDEWLELEHKIRVEELLNSDFNNPITGSIQL